MEKRVPLGVRPEVLRKAVISGCLLRHYKKGEVEVVRTRITLACTECKHRNYNLTKEKKNHPERMEVRKYCPFCKRHTAHKETK